MTTRLFCLSVLIFLGGTFVELKAQIPNEPVVNAQPNVAASKIPNGVLERSETSQNANDSGSSNLPNFSQFSNAPDPSQIANPSDIPESNANVLSPASNGTPDSAIPSEQIQFLLTRQGVIVSGIVKDKDKSIYLQLPNGGGGFTISKLDIEFVGKTRREIFDYQRTQIRPNDWNAVLKLADWAGRNDLETEALAMLNETSPRIVERSAAESVRQKIVQLEAIQRIKANVRRQEQETATADVKVGEETRTEKDALELWAKSVPQNVQERYLRRIQPILLRRCLRCHSGDETSGDYALQKPPANFAVREANLNNMRETFAWIDFSNPSNSPLLSHSPITASNDVAIFGSDRNSMKDYENFVEWINELPKKLPRYIPDPVRQKKNVSQAKSPAYNPSGVQLPPTATNSNERFDVDLSLFAQDLTQNALETNPETEDANRINDRILENESADDRFIDGNPAENFPSENDATGLIQTGRTAETANYRYEDVNSPEKVLQRGDFVPDFVPKDDFDPTLFNLRYHPDKVRLPKR